MSSRAWDGNGPHHTGWVPVATFIVPGQPKSKARPRFGRGRVYTEPATVAAETRVIDAFEFACPLWEPTLDHVWLTVDINYRGKAIGDGDNVVKMLTDGLQGHMYVNDRQIRRCEYVIHEHAGERAGLVITFSTRKTP